MPTLEKYFKYNSVITIITVYYWAFLFSKLYLYYIIIIK